MAFALQYQACHLWLFCLFQESFQGLANWSQMLLLKHFRERGKKNYVFHYAYTEIIPERIKIYIVVSLVFVAKTLDSFDYTICFIQVLILPTRPGMTGYLLNHYGPFPAYSVHESITCATLFLCAALWWWQWEFCTHRVHRIHWQSTAEALFFFFFNVVWKKLFLWKQITSSAWGLCPRCLKGKGT